MKRVTRAVSTESLRALLEHPPRATLAFVRDDVIESMPVVFQLFEERYLFGIPRTAGPLPAKAKLLIDDGPWYFDLRGAWMRGPVSPSGTPAGGDTTLDWYELTREKTVAWHYGEMREA